MENSLLEIPVAKTDSDVQVKSDHSCGAFLEPLRNISPEKLHDATKRTSCFSHVAGKRILDLLVCVALLSAVLPLFLVIALIVHFDSPGPIFYREQRVGRGGSRFTILKFRSMYTKEHLQDVLGYDECERTQLNRRQHGKVKSDPRITRVGRFLRQTSLDELPQIINIFAGEMTLVGPRPVVIAELMAYGDQAVFYKMLVPGLTGLWQVSGRSTLTFQKRIELDARYCTEWSAWLDLKIAAKTVPAVLRRHGAF